MSLKGIATETLEILERGSYRAPSGAMRHIGAELSSAKKGTSLYTPEQLASLLEDTSREVVSSSAQIDVTLERTQVAARRLCQDEGIADVVLLNFASARNAGGGFINGAKAQEEDLSRCSGLYPCLLEQTGYYTANRAQSSMLYTDHIIYSPGVPFFRERSRSLLEEPYTAAVITAPAPNAGQHLRRKPTGHDAIEEALRRRAAYVLLVAKQEGHRTLLLGAWGCGVFQNRPAMVADAFGTWLDAPEFATAFDRVCFAIYDRTRERRTFEAFRQRLD